MWRSGAMKRYEHRFAEAWMEPISDPNFCCLFVGQGDGTGLGDLATRNGDILAGFIIRAVAALEDKVAQRATVEHRIGDPRIIRLIQKWLKAGVLEDRVVTVSDQSERLAMGEGSSVAGGSHWPSPPKVGAVCLNRARTDLVQRG
jgi:hypothetical protein